MKLFQVSFFNHTKENFFEMEAKAHLPKYDSAQAEVFYFVNVISCGGSYQNVEEFVVKSGIAQLGT